MICICGILIPEDAPQYPIKPQRVIRSNKRGQPVKTWETHIVRCESRGMLMHTVGTEWNFVEQTKARHGHPYRVEEP